MVANLVSGLLAPTPTHFAPTQNGPFRARTATEDMSPVLNEVVDAKTTDECKKNLKKLAEAGADTLAGQLDTEDPVQEPDEETAVEAEDRTSAPETGRCIRKWVCLPAQDYPLLTTFCPGQDVVERETATEAPVRTNEWAWDWN